MKSLCFTPFFPKVKLNFVFLYRKLFIFFYDYYAVKGLLMRFAEIFQNILQQSLLLYQFDFSFLEQHHPIVSCQSKITKSYSGIFLVKIVIQYSYKLICLVIQEAKKSQLLSFFFFFSTTLKDAIKFYMKNCLFTVLVSPLSVFCSALGLVGLSR